MSFDSGFLSLFTPINLSIIFVLTVLGHTIFISGAKYKWVIFALFAITVIAIFLEDLLYILLITDSKILNSIFEEYPIEGLTTIGHMVFIIGGITPFFADKKLLPFHKKIFLFLISLSVIFFMGIGLDELLELIGINSSNYIPHKILISLLYCYFLWYYFLRPRFFVPEDAYRRLEKNIKKLKEQRKENYKKAGLSTLNEKLEYTTEFARRLDSEEGDSIENAFMLASMRHDNIIADKFDESNLAIFNRIIELIMPQTAEEKNRKFLELSYAKKAEILWKRFNLKEASFAYSKALELAPENENYLANKEDIEKVSMIF